MNEWLEIMIVLSMAGSTIVACILVLQHILQSSFSARWQYLLTKLAIFFFLVPVWFIVQRLTFLITESNRIIDTIQAGYGEAVISKQYLSIELAISILSVWGIGVVIFGSWYVYCYGKFSKEIKRSNLPIPGDSDIYELLNAYKKVMKIKHNIKLAYNDQIASPALIGLLKPTILLPIREIPDVELNMVLHHELIHFKRKDVWIKMFMLVASSLHWFNPFVHTLRRKVYIWSELSCDEEVVADMSYAERKRYGETILNMLEDSLATPASYSAFLSENKKNLKKRLTMLLHIKTMKKSMLVIAATSMITIGMIGTTVSALATGHPFIIDTVGAKKAIFNPDDQKAEEVYTDSF